MLTNLNTDVETICWLAVINLLLLLLEKRGIAGAE